MASVRRLRVEDLVHGHGSVEAHWAQLMAVDRLGDMGTCVPAQFRDVFQAHAAIGEQGYEAMSQFHGVSMRGG